MIAYLGVCPLMGMAQPSTLEVQEYFQGAIYYEVQTSGTNALELKKASHVKRMAMFFREGDFILRTFDGAFPKTLMYLNKYDNVFVIDIEKKKIFLGEQYRTRYQEPPAAFATGDSARVAGVMCREYELKREDSRTLFYINNNYRVNLGYFKGKYRSQAHFLIKNLQGCIPLKTVTISDTLTITTTATTLKPEPLSAEQFTLPPGFQIVKGLDKRPREDKRYPAGIPPPQDADRRLNQQLELEQGAD